MHWGKFAFTLLVVGLVLAPVNAQDFSASLNTNENSVCPSNHVIYRIDLDSQSSNEFNIRTEGIDSDWVKITPSDVSLNSGESETVYVYVQPFYTAEAGTHNFSIVVDNGETEERLNAELRVLNCRDASLDANPVNVCTESTTNLVINVENRGAFEDEFRITTNRDWAEFDSTIEMSPGESQTISIPIENPPVGNNILTINLDSTVSYTETSVNVPVNSENCYDVSLSLDPEKVEVCPGKTESMNLNIENTGARDDTYDISTTDDFVNIDQSRASVNSGDSERIRLTTSAGLNETLDKDYSINVEGNESGTVTGTVDIIDYDTCYSLDLFPEEGRVEMNSSTNKVVRLDVTNEGRFEEQVTIQADIENWMETAPMNLTLAPEETKNVYLYLAPPFETETGNYEVSIRASSNTAEATDNVRVSVSGVDNVEDDINLTIPNTREEVNQTLTSRLRDVATFFFSPFASLADSI